MTNGIESAIRMSGQAQAAPGYDDEHFDRNYYPDQVAHDHETIGAAAPKPRNPEIPKGQPMKKFSRHKTLDEITGACRAAGFEVDTEQYDHGSDHVTIDGIFAGRRMAIIYNTFNGRFLAPDDDGHLLTERSANLDGIDWYDAILEFLYVADEPAAEETGT